MADAKDRRWLAFGTGDKGHRLRADQNAVWENLPGVEIVSRTATTSAMSVPGVRRMPVPD